MKTKYLLDTNICIFLLKNKYGVREAVKKANPANCYRKEERLKDVDFIVRNFKILPIYPALPIFGDIRAELEEKGSRLDDFDLLIGATAIHNKLVIVTDNVKHLGRLPNVIIENWTDSQNK